MKRVGFIGEGESERILLSSQAFNDLLFDFDIESVGVFDAGGRDQLLSKTNRIDDYLKIFNDLKAEKIFILIDLENEPCISFCKNKFENYPENCLQIFSVKAIESWLLSDNSTLEVLLKGRFNFIEPEKTESQPLDTLRKIFIEKNDQGLGIRKPRIIKRFIKNGFSIINAANHPNCHSAKYFIKKLKEFSEE